MSTVVVLPEHYGYVALATISTGFLNILQIQLVSSARKKANVKYPQMYAEKSEMESNFDAMKFNCAQRAHQNTLEFVPYVLFLTPFLGLRYPILAASLGAAWSCGRVFYTLGYVTGDPAKRYNWGGFLIPSLAFFGLLAGSTYAAAELALGKW